MQCYFHHSNFIEDKNNNNKRYTQAVKVLSTTYPITINFWILLLIILDYVMLPLGPPNFKIMLDG